MHNLIQLIQYRMPINLRIFTTPSDKNVILSKKLARKGDIFMNLSIQDELQLFSEELYRHLTLFWKNSQKN